MPLTVDDVFRRARRVLFDPTAVRWTDPELLAYLSDAQTAIVQYRPEAGAVNRAVTLVSGTRQTIPAGGLRLLRVIRNLTTPRAIREVNRLALDAENPGWHGMPATTTVTHFCFDQHNPRNFFVYPPAAAGVSIEIVYAATPAPLTMGSAITVGAQYVNQLVNWVVYRALSKDATYAGDMPRAEHYLREFANGLDVAMASEAAAAFPRGRTASALGAPGEVV